MSDYRATPDQWEKVLGWSEDHDVSVSCDAACILELRARVEALEARNKPGFMGLSVTTSTVSTSKSLCSDSLVRRVAAVLHRETNSGLPVEDWGSEAREAISEVATWLEEEFGPQIDWITTELREEACSD